MDGDGYLALAVSLVYWSNGMFLDSSMMCLRLIVTCFIWGRLISTSSHNSSSYRMITLGARGGESSEDEPYRMTIWQARVD